MIRTDAYRRGSARDLTSAPRDEDISVAGRASRWPSAIVSNSGWRRAARSAATAPRASLEIRSAMTVSRRAHSYHRSRGRRGSAGCPQHGCELLARPDLELVVDVAKVVFDRLWAQVQLRRGLAGRPSFGQRERHLELLGCQRVAGVVVTHAGRLPACDQLGEGPRRPGAGAEAIERGQRGAQLPSGLNPPPGATEALAVAELRAGALEGVRRAVVVAERRFELGLELVVGSQQPAHSGGTGEGERLALGFGQLLVVARLRAPRVPPA